MLKPLKTMFKGREITLECTHKRDFPPPQMYGSTPADIDTLWKQGTIDQNQYQHLKIWQEKCGLMVMGPRCLDCPLALKQNPRPGRPHVIETENWLEAKNQMHWEDMKAGKLAPTQETEEQMELGGLVASPEADTPAEGILTEPASVKMTKRQKSKSKPKSDAAQTMVDNDIVDPDPAPSTKAKAKKPPADEEPASIADIFSTDVEEAEEEGGGGDDDLDDDIISALADD